MKKIQIGILIIFLVLTGCFKENTIKLNLFSNPEKIDAQNATNSGEKLLVSHIFEGLTTEDSRNKIVHGVAESWSVNGKIWTFNIDKNAKWQNGEKVIAEDFVTGWERVLNSKNSNKLAYMLYPIKGAMDYNQGDIIDFKAVGVKALSDSILQVELNSENPYFENLVAHPIFYPMNKEFYESHKEKYGVGKKNILGNGPYKIRKWKEFEEISLEKSGKYIDVDSVKVENINFAINGDVVQLKKMYMDNEIDVLDLSSIGGAEYKNNKEKRTFETGEVGYIQINTKEMIFSNPKIRKALAMTIDRKEFVNAFKGEEGKVAESFITGNISGKKDFYRREYPQTSYGITYDANKAKTLFQEGLSELGLRASDIKNITLLVKANDVEIKMANFLKNQFKQNLNFTISIVAETSQMREQMLSSGEYGMTLGAFTSDIANASNYLECWNSYNYNNLTGWKNIEYDKILTNVLFEKDSSKRIQILANGESILMTELPIIPITFSKKDILIKNKIEGMRLSNISKELNFKFASIKKEK